MAACEKNQRLIELEGLVLRALCRGSLQERATPPASAREEARRRLAGYRWREPLHQAIFAIVVSLPSDDPKVLREQLPARLTRRGFPDFELDDFFRPVDLSYEQVLRLIEEMTSSGGS